MNVAELRFIEYTGQLDERPRDFFETRLARPIDLYEEHRHRTELDDSGLDPDAESIPIRQVFVEIETDDGTTGIAGPISRAQAQRASRFEDILIGEDPLATEKLWDVLYRDAVHGRKGEPMMAISAIDIALWDLKGRHLGEPVYRLLGGPTRTKLPTYASMLRFSVDPDRVRERAKAFKDKGFGAQKWFFRYGVGSGRDGQQHNAALVEAAREAVGDEYDLMFDAWMSWDRTYTLEMIDRIAAYNPRWVEEPVQPDKLDQYAELRDRAPFPIAGGEHEYTRWGIHELLTRNAVDVLQPDTFWAGGVTEMRHICSLASAYDIPVIPHGHSVPVNVHVIAAQPGTVCPLVEYLVKHNRQLQFFFEDPYHPVDGSVQLSDQPGFGITIDETRVAERRELDLT